MTKANLCNLFAESVATGGDTIALRTVDDSLTITWTEYGDRVRSLAAGLAGLGLRRGDTIGLLLTNRPEFNLLDAAAMHLGAVPFSLYNTSAPEQIHYVLTNAANRVIVCEGQYLDKIREASIGTGLEHIVCLDEPHDGTLSLADLEGRAPSDFDFAATWRAVEPTDVVTLIYTSGTTGPPKGVELTHANVLAALEATVAVAGDFSGGGVVSYLPDAHLVNRYVAHYAPMAYRLTVTTVADPKTLLDALTTVRPTFFVAVPMLWYKIKTRLEAALLAEGGAKAAIGGWAMSVGQQMAAAETAGTTPSVSLRVRHALADRFILSAVRKRLGLDRVRMAVSGAAPIAEEALLFMLGLGIPVCEAWGMSETTALSTMNRPGSIRIGTVGTAAPGTEVVLAADGELLVRGPGVMRGYRNDPERTAEAIDADGWMHTGDIGTIDEHGYVRIVDRKKELIINSAGKNMSPANIENTLKVSCPLVGSSIAIGDQRPHVAALITLDEDAASAYAESQGLDLSPAALASDAGVLAAIQTGVDLANSKLARVEHIRTWRLLPTFWEPGGDELTPTMKLKRKPIAAKYAEEIETLYASV